MEMSRSLFDEIHGELWKVRIIDTHEHLPSEKERTGGKGDFFWELFGHYASSDLISSGMSDSDLEYVRNPENPLKKRWNVFEPYWEKISNTGYARSLDIAVKGIYGEDGITGNTYTAIAEKMRTSNRKGLYKKILKEKSVIDVSILDRDTWECDREFFVPVVRPDAFVLVRSPEDIKKLEKMRSVSIHTIDDLLNALEGYLDEFAVKGAVGIKLPFAYLRPISFEKTTKYEAEKAFNSIAISDSNPHIENSRPFQEMKPLQDYLIHFILRFAETRSLPVQIHTGLQEGNRNFIHNSDPSLLTNLFIEYPTVQFDLFHASYPFSRILACLAKNFRNVYIDMCWFHIMSPCASRSMLNEWLDLVPANKIFGFGGDYCFIEGVYGHAVMAREDIAKVLAWRVEEGLCDVNSAMKTGRMLLYDNANIFFDIGSKRKIKALK